MTFWFLGRRKPPPQGGDRRPQGVRKMVGNAWAAIRGLQASIRDIDNRLIILEQARKRESVAQARASKREDPPTNGATPPDQSDAEFLGAGLRAFDG